MLVIRILISGDSKSDFVRRITSKVLLIFLPFAYSNALIQIGQNLTVELISIIY